MRYYDGRRVKAGGRRLSPGRYCFRPCCLGGEVCDYVLLSCTPDSCHVAIKFDTNNPNGNFVEIMYSNRH